MSIFESRTIKWDVSNSGHNRKRGRKPAFLWWDPFPHSVIINPVVLAGLLKFHANFGCSQTAQLTSQRLSKVIVTVTDMTINNTVQIDA